MILKILKGFFIPGLIIPILIGLLFYKASKFDKNAKSINKWFLKNFWAYALIITAAIQIYTEYRSLTKFEIGNEKLVVFSIRDFENDLEEKLDSTFSIESKSVKELMYKFEIAQYAFDNGDYEKHISTLQEIINGKDNYGNLMKIESYVIYNNLAISSFFYKRNKDFECSNYLFQAINKVESASSQRVDIDNNIKILDRILNITE